MPMTIEQIVFGLRSERGRRNENAVGNAVDLLFEECRIDSLTRGPTLERKGIDVRIGIGTKFYNLSVKSSVGGVVHEREIHHGGINIMIRFLLFPREVNLRSVWRIE